MRIAIVMITIDRSASGRENYLASTMQSLKDSGMQRTKVPYDFYIFDGGSESIDYISALRSDIFPITIYVPIGHKLSPNMNAGRALLIGSQVQADWVLFLEDDIEVCKDFLDGVAWWLNHFADTRHRLFTFYTCYHEVEQQHKGSGVGSWEYPVDKFYGTQCMALRPREAQSIGEYLVGLSYPTSSYDIEIQNWTKAFPNLMQEGSECFLASVPCFVQHIGEQSVLFNDPKRFHQCTSYQGKDWSLFKGMK